MRSRSPHAPAISASSSVCQRGGFPSGLEECLTAFLPRFIQWGGGFTFNRLENVFGTESVLKTVNLKSSVRRNLPVD